MRQRKKYFNIDGWKSDSKPIQNVYDHLKDEKSGSLGSKKKFDSVMGLLCNFTDRTPDQLLQMDKQSLETQIREFLLTYSNTLTRQNHLQPIKTFFRENQRNDLDYPEFYNASRPSIKLLRLSPATIWKMAFRAGPTKHKLVILIPYVTGFRTATLRAILLASIKTEDSQYHQFSLYEQIKRGEKNPLMLVYPEMKEIDPDACKCNIPYFTFLAEEVTELVAAYIEEREDKYGEIGKDEMLFPSEHRGFPGGGRLTTPMTAKAMNDVYKETAKKAGVKDWETITESDIRDTYLHILDCQNVFTEDEKDFHKGRILEKPKESYRRWDPDAQRAKYAMLNFMPDALHGSYTYWRPVAIFHKINYDFAVCEAEALYGKVPTREQIEDTLRQILALRVKSEYVDYSDVPSRIEKGWELISWLPGEQKALMNQDVLAHSFETYKRHSALPSLDAERIFKDLADWHMRKEKKKRDGQSRLKDFTTSGTAQ
jgi:hypothetical protein